MTDRRKKSREVRLGLVMYGGVSLAIYINGVAQEFYRAVRGRGVYKLIKALTDSDIVVDIISGTSAGGINGIYLAYALCNQREFSSFSQLWRDYGDIGWLLRDYKEDSAETVSVLDSEDKYQEKLKNAFYTMGPCNTTESEDISDINELDLFITGTDVDGVIQTVFDAAGHPIDVKNHRAVFVLKHRQGRKEPFNPVFHQGGVASPDPEITHQALATLARITSSFPAAFAPVEVKLEKPGDTSADGKLQLWGNLRRKAYFLDGGVLDNKPFTHTIKEIFYRLADCEVDRKLFYVEPDPERFKKKGESVGPNIFQAVTRSLIGIPGYESICEDLRLLSEHNRKVETYNRFVKHLQQGTWECISPENRAFIEKLQQWEQSPGRSAHAEPEQGCEYQLSRLIAFKEAVLAEIVSRKPRDFILGLQDREKREKFDHEFLNMTGSGVTFLTNFDERFRLRRLFHIMYSCYNLIFNSKETVKSNDLKTGRKDTGEGASVVHPKDNLPHHILNAFNRQIKLLEVLAAAIQDLYERLPLENEMTNGSKFWSQILSALQHLTNVKDEKGDILPPGYENRWKQKETPEGWLPQGDLSEFNRRLKSRIESILKQVSKGSLEGIPDKKYESILKRTDKIEKRMLEFLLRKEIESPELKKFRALEKSYDDFIFIDAQLFPLQMFGNMSEKDVIETVRISPVDAKKGYSNKSLRDKVSGDILFHFGGFFKKSWRSNDILWGRLDALCQLVETLFDKARVRKVLSDITLRETIREGLKNELSPAALFSQSIESYRNDLESWLHRLVSEDNKEREKALCEEGKIGMLIEAAQLEILEKDLPEVIKDAVEEQAKWNQFRISKKKKLRIPGYDPGTDCFVSADGDLDPLVVSVASKELAAQALERLKKQKDGSELGNFFRNSYKVGSESLLRDIPPLVLLEIATRALLVLRNCVLKSFGSFSKKIKKNILYKIVNSFLLLLHWLVLFLRKTPGTTKRYLSVLLALFLLLTLLVGIGWRREIIYPAGTVSLPWLIIFIVVPVFLLSIQFMFLRRRFSKKGK